MTLDPQPSTLATLDPRTSTPDPQPLTPNPRDPRPPLTQYGAVFIHADGGVVGAQTAAGGMGLGGYGGGGDMGFGLWGGSIGEEI